MKTQILLDHESVADGGWLVRALLRIEGESRADEGRVPLNLSLVLDRSGSMSGEKLAAAREAAIQLVKRLSPDDTVSVVAYDNRVETVALPATGDEQESLTGQIAAIRPGGMTNLSGGWLQGRDYVAGAVREGGVNRVLLLTDGLANEGITDPAKLTGLCRTAAGSGITTTTIVFGVGYDEQLLSEMADAGSGGAYYIEETDQAIGIFEEELEGLLSISAQNVKVRIEPADTVEAPSVLHSYPAHVDGDVLVLEIGDLYAREPRPILAEFLLKPPEDGHEDEEVEVAKITVTAHVLTAEGGVELQEITLPVRLCPVEGGFAEPEVRRELLLVEAARARREALEARERGDWDGAKLSLRNVMQHLSPLADSDSIVAEELSDLEGIEARMSSEAFREADAKYMHYRARHGSRGERSKAARISRKGREDGTD